MNGCNLRTGKNGHEQPQCADDSTHLSTRICYILQQQVARLDELQKASCNDHMMRFMYHRGKAMLGCLPATDLFDQNGCQVLQLRHLDLWQPHPHCLHLLFGHQHYLHCFPH